MDVDPDWKPPSNDANEDLPEDKEMEYDEDVLNIPGPILWT